MIHTLDTKAADYIPELGDGFEEGSEGSENAQGLQVADYYADADGEGIYYITYKIETAKEIEQLFVFAGRKQLLRLGKRKAGEVIEGTLYLQQRSFLQRQKFRQSIWQEIPRLLIRLVQSHICRADATVHGDSALHILSEEVQPLIIRRTADLPQKPFVMRATTIS